MRIISICFLLLIVCKLKSQSINELKLDSSISSSKQYSFYISGHFYGSGLNKTHYPTNTVLGNIKRLNSVDFIVCLGDLFKDIKNDVPYYRRSFFNQLEVPLYNAVGNHDLSGNLYEEEFEKTFYSFITPGIRHIVLNTELDDSRIEGEQLDSLAKWLKVEANVQSNQIFIYSHRPIWAEDVKELEGVFPDNTQSKFGTNFNDDIYPLLAGMVDAGKNVYWFSGSMGAAPVSFFYHEYQGIKLVQTALRGIERDALLKVNVFGSSISFETESLTGQELLSLEKYNLKFWRGFRKPIELNYRLIPLWIENTIFHRYFWYGVFITVVIVFLGFKLVNRK